MDNSLNSVLHLLRDPDTFFACLRRGKSAHYLSSWLAIASVVCLSIFGLVIGMAHSPWQAFSSAIKMPVLVMGAGLLCLPALYLFALALGTRLCMTQVAAVVLAGLSVTALLLLGLSPIVFVFVLTSRSYPFLQLLIVGSVAISGCIGLYYLWRGMECLNLFERASAGLRHGVMSAWFVLFAFVGSQMAWRLSPFAGDPSQPFVWLQPSHDNLYVDVLHALENASGFNLPMWDIQPMWLGILCLAPVALLIVGAGLATSSEEI